MEILNSLGFNSTIFIQFALGLFAILVLVSVFNKYLAAYKKREENTQGSQHKAVALEQEAIELQKKFETRATEVNLEIQKVFQKIRKQAIVEQDEIFKKAREQSTVFLDENRKKIEAEYAKALAQKDTEVQKISQDIVVKLLGKETTA